MKKVFAVLLVLMLVISLFTGCNKNDETDETTTTTKAATTTATTTTESMEPYTVVSFIMGDPAAMRDLEQVNMYINDELEARGSDYRLDYNFIDWGSYEQTMNLKIQSQEKFDTCFTASWILNYYSNAQRNAFAPLKDMLMSDFKDLYDFTYGPSWDALTVGGDIYAVPNYKEVGMNRSFWIRKSVADKAGVTIPEEGTYEDYDRIVRELKPHAGDMQIMVGYSSIEGVGGEGVGIDNTMVGIDIGSEDTTVHNVVDTDEFKKVSRIAAALWEDGFFPADMLSTDVTFGDAFYGASVYAFESVYHPTVAGQFEQRYGDKWLPLKYRPFIAKNGDLAGSNFAVSSTSENPKASLHFLHDLMIDEFVCNAINFGIEGKHYEFRDKEKGLIKLPEGIKSAAEAGYENVHTWSQGSLFTQYVWPTEFDNKHELYTEFNAMAKPSALIGFVLDQSSIEAEIGALNNLYTKVNAVFLGATGKDLETGWADFIKEQEANGIDTVIAEAQKQIDAWKASK